MSLRNVSEAEHRSMLRNVAEKKSGLTILGVVIIVAGLAVLGLCIALGVVLGDDPANVTHETNPLTFTSLFARGQQQQKVSGSVNDLFLYMDTNGDSVVSVQEFLYGFEFVRCQASYPGEAFQTERGFNCLDRDRNGVLSDTECVDFGDETLCEDLMDDNGVIEQINWVCAAEHHDRDLMCPTQVKRKGFCKAWNAELAAGAEKVQAVFDAQAKNASSGWAIANEICYSRVAAFSTGGGGSDDAAGARQRQLAKSSKKKKEPAPQALTWRELGLICGNRVDEDSHTIVVDTGTGQVESEGKATTFPPANCQMQSSDPREVATQGGDDGGDADGFLRDGEKSECAANACHGLNDGRCRPDMTGGRCVWYDKDDAWNPYYMQTGCFPSPCTNPVPNKGSVCRMAPFQLPGAEQERCNPNSDEFNCNLYRCDFCKGQGKKGVKRCENRQFPAEYDFIMSEMASGGMAPMDNLCMTGKKGTFNKKVCSGTRDKPCLCSNLFCSDPTLNPGNTCPQS